ncbi:hypothetical protein H4R19_006486 [Coemansia spiralis]|nr:hypothetical protein H4R19_006486 [Coemansia spiralis]
MAVASIVSAAVRIAMASGTVAARQSGVGLRALTWIMLAADFYMAVAVGCIAVGVWATLQWASGLGKVMSYIDYFGLASLLATHPIWYIGHKITWNAAQHVDVDGSQIWLRHEMWPMFLLWTAIAIVLSFVALLCTLERLGLSELFVQERVNSPFPGFRNAIMSVVRFLAYPVLLMLTQGWPVLQALFNRPWLLRMANTAPAAQGILCLAVLVVGPHGGRIWSAIRTPATRSGASVLASEEDAAGRDETAVNSSSSSGGGGSSSNSTSPYMADEKDLQLDFTNRNASTINLSPYQSRASSLC